MCHEESVAPKRSKMSVRNIFVRNTPSLSYFLGLQSCKTKKVLLKRRFSDKNSLVMTFLKTYTKKFRAVLHGLQMLSRINDRRWGASSCGQVGNYNN